MSVIDLSLAKKWLDVIHNSDDDKLQMLLDAAEDEAMQFMDLASFDDLEPCTSEAQSGAVSDFGGGLPGSVVLGVLLLLQAGYQASPDEIPKLRSAAETKLMPYRRKLGV